mmetsp:Transcript_9385/g.21174  ORF Transcript_9385/g.21174 Transcript_9385/m.21174 type:complete len:163 (+) Transcript_9385:184-672(+)
MAQQPIRRRDHSSTETCGYMTFLLSNIFFIVYFLWALLPDQIIEHIDVHYTAYYPPRELAGYIPAYLSLLFVFVPILYMGLNMITCPKVDCIDGIWDTRSNACCMEDYSIRNDDLLGECKKECGNVDNTSNQIDSLPAICDEDVRLVNLRIRQQLKRQSRNW